MKTKDGIDVKVGMEIWVNPDCVFEDVIEQNTFTGKHIIASICNHIVWAHPEHSSVVSCDFFFEEIFAKRENWYKDRHARIEEVILNKRETLMLEAAKLEQELKNIEEIRNNWLE